MAQYGSLRLIDRNTQYGICNTEYAIRNTQYAKCNTEYANTQYAICVIFVVAEMMTNAVIFIDNYSY